jgi:hypothetical protein
LLITLEFTLYTCLDVLFKVVQIFDLVSTFSWLLQFGDLFNSWLLQFGDLFNWLCISVAFLGTETKIMGHASIM